MTLCNDDVLKFEEASRLQISAAFTYLGYIKDKQTLSK